MLRPEVGSLETGERPTPVLNTKPNVPGGGGGIGKGPSLKDVSKTFPLFLPTNSNNLR